MEIDINDLTEQVIAAAIEVHRFLGPGLLESTYESCLVFELAQRRLRVERQKALPVTYKGIRIDCGYRLDLLVCDRVIVEVKAVHALERVHEAQLLSYLKLSGRHVGLAHQLQRTAPDPRLAQAGQWNPGVTTEESTKEIAEGTESREKSER